VLIDHLTADAYLGQWDHVSTGPYSLCLNQWGKQNASSGTACASFTFVDGINTAWKTTWTWTGDYAIKSYTNMQLDQGLNKRLSDIKEIPVRQFILCINILTLKKICRQNGSGPNLLLALSLQT